LEFVERPVFWSHEQKEAASRLRALSRTKNSSHPLSFSPISTASSAQTLVASEALLR